MIVPIVFIILCIVTFFVSGLPLSMVYDEMLFRLSRNLFLVMALIIPVISGMGLNFGIVLGAMAGQAGLIFISNYYIGGMTGIFLAIVLSTPLAILLGWMVGRALNKAKGKEMITSMIMGFFASGIYQLIFLVFAGRLFPIKNKALLLPSGVGLKNTIDLELVRRSFDKFIFYDLFKNVSPTLARIPIATYLFIIICFVVMYRFLKTKLGQDMRAIGQSMQIANVSGINVDKTRIISIIISTVLAAWGQILFLQNMGNMSTYTNHENVGFFSVASLLIGGATVEKATWQQAVLGTFLFHLLFVISPIAGQKLVGNAQLGEYFRVFLAYGVIGIALILHAWEKNKKKNLERLGS